jgi:hypothetical protein
LVSGLSKQQKKACFHEKPVKKTLVVESARDQSRSSGASVPELALSSAALRSAFSIADP